MKAFKSVLICIPWTFAFIGVLWLFVHRFPPSGTIVFDIPFDGTSAWMDPFLPAERVTSPGAQEGGWRGQRILQDPVYSAARVPGVFDEVELSVEFRPNRQSYAELGILRDDASLAYEFFPIWFSPLQSTEWREASLKGISGYVRQNVSDSVLHSSDYAHLEVWHASSTPLLMQDPSANLQETRVSLRGSHDFWVLPSGGSVRFEFDLQDANRSDGGRSAILQIMKGDETIKTAAIGLGGSLDTRMGTVITARIEAHDLTPGVYEVRVISDDNIFIRAIRTTSAHWVVGPRLVFGDVVGYATSTPIASAWSDSRHLVLETFHNEGLQTVRFGTDVVVLLKTHAPVNLNRTDTQTTPQQFTAPKADVRIVGDGYFSFTPQAFFVPQPRRVTVFTDPNAEGIDAILTPYHRPQALDDGWYRTTIRFTLDPSRDHSRFVLSIPGALANHASFDIRRVVLTYKRPPLDFKEWFHVVRQELGNAWRRLRSG
jgi:hypothetical protein